MRGTHKYSQRGVWLPHEPEKVRITAGEYGHYRSTHVSEWWINFGSVWLADHLNDMTCNVRVLRCDSKEQPRDRTLEANVFLCVDLSCSLGNRQQQEKKSLGVIGQRFYPLWPIKPHLCAHKQPIRDLMPSWGDRRISSGNTLTHTHTHVCTLGNIIYLCTHKWMFAVMRELEQNDAVLSVCVFSTNTVLEPVLIQGTKKPFCEPANIATDLRAELL